MSRVIFLLCSLLVVAVVVVFFKHLDDHNLVGTQDRPHTIKSELIITTP